ncbi:transmembrane protein 60-like [Engraulis encrasicolus]|uniref:transmembrane protein 60-like n=1 Tax=Engraulis encrasicolus TaxID=184585 RepID=UPI002FD11B2E
MSLAQRALLAWMVSLVFLSLLVLKLDGRLQWSWFLVFTPVWLLDAALLLLLLLRMAGRCKAGYDHQAAPLQLRLRRKAWHLAAVLLQLAFCLALCARLHGLTGLLMVYVCVPLWLLLTGALVELGCTIFPAHSD